jgi:pimeloyl-ACP methyl ester carboxylesterase
VSTEPVARERRPTLYFLNEIKAFSPVFLDTEVDMSRVRAHRDTAREAGRHYSWVSYLLYTTGRVLASHPEANAAIRSRIRPKVGRYDTVNGKFTMDHTANGHRVVLSAVLPGLHAAGLDEIQRQVTYYSRGDREQLPEFAGAQLIRKLPWPFGEAVLRSWIRPLRHRPARVGTFALTSLSHRAVDGFYSVGGTTITLGLGRITDRPVVRDGEVAVAPVMRLSLTFDHRVIDGAEAADVLTEIKEGLEDFPHLTAGGGGAADRMDGTNDVAELKQFVVAHARAQKVCDYQKVLDRIRTDAEGDGSWTAEWCRSARQLEQSGQLLDASRHYAMARFPFVDGPARQAAFDQAVNTFDRWRRDDKNIQRLDLDLPGGHVGCWATGLSEGGRLPLLILIGGIVSVKEQWAARLASFRRLGVAAVVTEMPGVGENTLPYTKDSWTMLSRLLDHVADQADVSNSYALALSFSGHLALRCALDDNRIRAVLTAGAPISTFFTDRDWQARLPRVTVDTLAHLMNSTPADALAQLRDWALSAEQLAALGIPVRYVACDRDEIIPPADVALLSEHVRNVGVLRIDDVHGAPANSAQSQLWLVRSLAQAYEGRRAANAVIELLWQLTGLRRKSAVRQNGSA